MTSSVLLQELSRDVRALRADVRGYHETVVRASEQAAGDRRTLLRLVLAVDGRDPPDVEAPGIKARLDSLEASRTQARRGLAWVWAALIGAATAALPMLWAR
jgi:hypothetical protein